MGERSGSRVYADHAAGSPPRPEVIATVREEMVRGHGNPSSPHEEGQAARRAVTRARRHVATLLGAGADEIVFTASGTEANNLALAGTVRAWRRELGVDARIRLVVGATDHHSVLRPAEALAAEGVELTVLGVDSDGIVAPERLAATLAEDAADRTLVSIGWVNGETGVVQNIAALSRVASEGGALVHTDAVQAAGRIPLDLTGTPVALCSISAHKLGGPSGAGVLVVRTGCTLEPVMHGGGQERGRRSGTPDVPAIAGMGEACRITRGALDDLGAGLSALTRRFEASLAERFPGVVVHGRDVPRLPGITSVAFPGADAEALVIALDLAGVAVSAGSACTTGAVERSHVLEAMGVERTMSRGTIRVSFGWSNVAGDVGCVLDALAPALSRDGVRA
jgi:cysteine desulfurase